MRIGGQHNLCEARQERRVERFITVVFLFDLESGSRLDKPVAEKKRTKPRAPYRYVLRRSPDILHKESQGLGSIVADCKGERSRAIAASLMPASVSPPSGSSTSAAAGRHDQTRSLSVREEACRNGRRTKHLRG